MTTRRRTALVLIVFVLGIACKECEAANRALKAIAAAVEVTAAVVDAACGAIGEPISGECEEAREHLAEGKLWLARAVLVVQTACGSLTTEQQKRVDALGIPLEAQARASIGPDFKPRKIESEAKRIQARAEALMEEL